MKASERLEEGSVPVFGSNGIVGYTSAPLTEAPAVIIGRKGSAGALNICNVPSWTTDVAYYVGSLRITIGTPQETDRLVRALAGMLPVRARTRVSEGAATPALRPTQTAKAPRPNCPRPPKT